MNGEFPVAPSKVQNWQTGIHSVYIAYKQALEGFTNVNKKKIRVYGVYEREHYCQLGRH